MLIVIVIIIVIKMMIIVIRVALLERVAGGPHYDEHDYPARARSARAQRACALRALGLLLADSAPTVGWGKTFWRVGRVPLTKTGVTWKRKVAQ